MSGGSSAPDTQTVKQEPWSGVQEPLKNLYGTTQSALGNILGPYPNQAYPNFTPLQESGMLGNLDYAQNYYAPATMGYQSQLGQYMDAPLNISQDPAVQAMMSANQQNATDWLTRSALPAIQGGAVNVGQMGSSRQGIAEGLAAGEAAKNLAQANAQTMLGAYGTASDLAGRSASLMPAALSMGFTPGDLAQQYGGQYQQLAGQGINQAMQNYYYPEQSLWDKLATAGGIYSGAGNYGTKTADVPGSSPLAGAIGGGMLGYSAAPAIASMFAPAAGAAGGAAAGASTGSALGPYGAIAGAILGAMMSR